MKRIIDFKIALAVGLCLSFTSFRSVKSTTVKLKPSDDIQTIVNTNPAGTAFKLTAGVYRMQVINPKDGDSFDGGDVAVLNGSKLLTEWTKEGDIWYVTGQAQEGLRKGEGRELPGHPRAPYPEDVFIDNVPLLHAEQIGDVKPGTFFFDYKSDRIYIGENPAGRKIETGISDQAFKGNACNVTIQGLTIEKYATPVQWGTIDSEFGCDWTVQDNIIQFNHGCGVNFGNGSKILRNKIMNNGHAGFGGGGKDWLLEGNEISNNGWAGIDPVFEGGGGKVTETTNGIIRGNRVSNNIGPGLWLDENANNITIEKNTCWGSPSDPGIMFEISNGVTIRNNTCINCQIFISSSSNAKVYGNTVDVNAEFSKAITVMNQNRPPHNPGINNEIYNNTIIIRGNAGSTGKIIVENNHEFAEFYPKQTTGKVGVENDYEPDKEDVFSKNSFHNNTYHLASLSGKLFMCDGRTDHTFTETQTAGHEAGSTADTNLPPADDALTAVMKPRVWPTLTDVPIDLTQIDMDAEKPGAGSAVWWKFDETSGDTVKDYSGKGHSGLLQFKGSANAWVAGHSGNALNFNGKDDNIYASGLGLFRNMTIALWVNPTKLDKEFNCILCTNGWRKGTAHFMTSGNGRIQFSLNGSDGTDKRSEKNVFTDDDMGKWKHIAIVYDCQAKTIKFYVNGALNATQTYTKAIAADMTGGLQIGGYNGGGRNFSGKFDDFRIYGRALSNTEVAELAKPEN